MTTPRRRLVGQAPEEVNGPNARRLVGDADVIQLPRKSIAVSAPLAAPAVNPLVVAHRGLRIRSARKRNLFDNRPSVVGMRTLFSVDFYDSVTKQPLSPTLVKLSLLNPSGGSFGDLNMVENTGRAGHYDASFLPTANGEWTVVLKYGSAGEVVERTTFYVLAQS